MVAQTIKLPNIRKFFVPDDGFVLAEADLSGADAYTVVWESNDEPMKKALREGMSVHIYNCRDLYPELTKDMTDEQIKATDHSGGLYHKVKQTAHGTNYGGTAKTLASITKQSIIAVEEFQERWFTRHPGIEGWHDRTRETLQTTRIITNPFGYRIMYFDRMKETFKKALAWLPQSVTACVTTRAAINLDQQFPYIEQLMEVHDSLIFQFPKEYRSELSKIKEALSVTVPYDDPLIIPWSLKTSETSWGDIE